MTSLRGHLLIASARLTEPTFARAVILVLRHDAADGALGLVLNRPLAVSVGEVVGPTVEAARAVGDALHLGGPCEGPLMALHGRAAADGADDEEEAVVRVLDGVWATSGRDEIEALMLAGGESSSPPVRYFAGYAGWGPGQLEGEIDEGAWRSCPATAADVFAPPGPDGRDPWHRLTARLTLGRWIDPDRIPDDPSAN